MKYEHMFQLFYFRSITLYAQDNSIAQSIEQFCWCFLLRSHLMMRLVESQIYKWICIWPMYKLAAGT